MGRVFTICQRHLSRFLELQCAIYMLLENEKVDQELRVC